MLVQVDRTEKEAAGGVIFGGKRVVELEPDQIAPNPAQPRKSFDTEELNSLAVSIRTNGLIQPITVRRIAGGNYELVAGERRLRACRIAGMKTVPCIINDCTPDESAAIAMAENLQRKDLGVFEEAEGIRKLINLWHITQEEAAQRFGKSQSAIANKLRLLRFSQEERQIITEAGLTERHARALLRIEDGKQRLKALHTVIERGYNVRRTDEYVSRLLSGKPEKPRRMFIVKDVRIFFNTISHAVDTMKKSGIPAQTLRSETEGYIECIVRIPKAQATAGGKRPA